MKMINGDFQFVGSPEELAEMFAILSRSVPNSQKVDPLKPNANAKVEVRSNEEPSDFVTSEFAKDVLTRLPLSKPMKSVIAKLTEANPAWVKTAELLKVSGYTTPQFAGLMGAFGRRMANTKNFEATAHFFDYRFDEGTGTWEYRLPPSVIDAVKECKLS